jgi:cell division protease FtsH
MSEKNTNDFTKKDWFDIVKESCWNVDYESHITRKFFDVEDSSMLTSHTVRTGTAEGLIIRYILDDFLIKHKVFSIIKIVDIYHSDQGTPTYSNIEYNPNQFKSCLCNGAFFLESESGKYILDVTEYEDTYSFKMTSLKETKPSCETIMNELKEYSIQHNFLKGQKISANCEFIKLEKKYTWDDLILPKRLKKDLRQNLSNLIDYFDIYKLNKLTLKRGLILSGPPGTGKSLLGKILCSTIDWTFVWVTPNDFSRPRAVKEVVDLCRALSPAILFLEDIDLYGQHRETNGAVELLGELLNRLDGLQENNDVITIATTNKVEVLEKALFDRPGRFDKVLAFLEPTEESRLNMLQKFTEGLNMVGVDFKEMNKQLSGLTGAHIKEFVNLSIIYAIDQQSLDANKKVLLLPGHFEDALSTVKKKDFGKMGFNKSSDDDDDDFFDMPRFRH